MQDETTTTGSPSATPGEDPAGEDPAGEDPPSEDPAVYEQLRRLALKLMKDERSGHTLQATALVHEAWMRIEASPGQGEGKRTRQQFLALASRMMRSILVDHARARVTLRRGGGRLRITTEEIPDTDRRDIDLLVMNEALERLAAIDERQAKIVEFRFFGGMTLGEIAAELGLSGRSVDREWAIARTWLFSAMNDDPQSRGGSS